MGKSETTEAIWDDQFHQMRVIFCFASRSSESWNRAAQTWLKTGYKASNEQSWLHLNVLYGTQSWTPLGSIQLIDGFSGGGLLT